MYSSTVIEYFIWIESLLRDHLSYKATFCPKRWPLNTGLTVLLLSRKQLQTDHIGDVMLKSACLEYARLLNGSPGQTKVYNIGINCFPAKYARE